MRITVLIIQTLTFLVLAACNFTSDSGSCPGAQGCFCSSDIDCNVSLTCTGNSCQPAGSGVDAAPTSTQQETANIIVDDPATGNPLFMFRFLQQRSGCNGSICSSAETTLTIENIDGQGRIVSASFFVNVVSDVGVFAYDYSGYINSLAGGESRDLGFVTDNRMLLRFAVFDISLNDIAFMPSTKCVDNDNITIAANNHDYSTLFEVAPDVTYDNLIVCPGEEQGDWYGLARTPAPGSPLRGNVIINNGDINAVTVYIYDPTGPRIMNGVQLSDDGQGGQYFNIVVFSGNEGVYPVFVFSQEEVMYEIHLGGGV